MAHPATPAKPCHLRSWAALANTSSRRRPVYLHDGGRVGFTCTREHRTAASVPAAGAALDGQGGVGIARSAGKRLRFLKAGKPHHVAAPNSNLTCLHRSREMARHHDFHAASKSISIVPSTVWRPMPRRLSIGKASPCTTMHHIAMPARRPPRLDIRSTMARCQVGPSTWTG